MCTAHPTPFNLLFVIYDWVLVFFAGYVKQDVDRWFPPPCPRRLEIREASFVKREAERINSSVLSVFSVAEHHFSRPSRPSRFQSRDPTFFVASCEALSVPAEGGLPRHVG